MKLEELNETRTLDTKEDIQKRIKVLKAQLNNTEEGDNTKEVRAELDQLQMILQVQADQK